MSSEITTEELIECLSPSEEGQECCIDEVLLLLRDYVEDERVKKLISHYVDLYYEWFDSDCAYVRALEKRVQDLEEILKHRRER